MMLHQSCLKRPSFRRQSACLDTRRRDSRRLLSRQTGRRTGATSVSPGSCLCLRRTCATVASCGCRPHSLDKSSARGAATFHSKSLRNCAKDGVARSLRTPAAELLRRSPDGFAGEPDLHPGSPDARCLSCRGLCPLLLLLLLFLSDSRMPSQDDIYLCRGFKVPAKANAYVGESPIARIISTFNDYLSVRLSCSRLPANRA